MHINPFSLRRSICLPLFRLKYRPFHLSMPDKLKALGEGCPGLQRLNVKGCDGVTDVGLAWMSNGCPALEYLDVSGCVKVTRELRLLA